VKITAALYFTAAIATIGLGARTIAPTTASLGGCECYWIGDFCFQPWPFCKPAKIEKPKAEPQPCPVPIDTCGDASGVCL
jgi:hypothetical protein